jgi:hypothetical protein
VTDSVNVPLLNRKYGVVQPNPIKIRIICSGVKDTF